MYVTRCIVIVITVESVVNVSLRQRVKRLKLILEDDHLYYTEYFLEGEELPWLREKVIELEWEWLLDMLDDLVDGSEVETLDELKDMLEEDYTKYVDGVADGNTIRKVRIERDTLFDYLDQLLEVNERDCDDFDVLLYETER